MGKCVRPSLTDLQVLDLFTHPTDWRCCLETAKLFRGSQEITPTVVGNQQVNGTRFRFEICHEGHKRTIQRSKLVWMVGSRRLVPPDHEIHHLDEDRYNDVWRNLICLHKDDHLKIHAWLESLNSQSTPF